MHRKITILIKPTDECNLRCVYCYHADYTYTKSMMQNELFDDIVNKCKDYYDEVKFIWHGGEPLLAPHGFYKEIVRKTRKFNELKNIHITNSIQTNGTLLTKELMELFSENDIHVGFSFDGLNNDITRGSTAKTLASMNAIKHYQKQVGAIKVVMKSDLKTLIDNYVYFRDNGFNMKLNPIHDCENTIKIDSYTPLEYANALFELFKFWYNDEQCGIHVTPFENYISILKNGYKRSCAHNSCLTKFVGITYKGDIYPCSRYYPDEYCIGNVASINKFEDIFDSSSFINIIRKAIDRRDNCAKTCNLFKYCGGGCNHDAMQNKSIEHNDFFTCALFKIIFPKIIDFFEADNMKNTRNPMLAKLIKSFN